MVLMSHISLWTERTGTVFMFFIALLHILLSSWLQLDCSFLFFFYNTLYSFLNNITFLPVPKQLPPLPWQCNFSPTSFFSKFLSTLCSPSTLKNVCGNQMLVDQHNRTHLRILKTSVFRLYPFLVIQIFALTQCFASKQTAWLYAIIAKCQGGLLHCTQLPSFY